MMRGGERLAKIAVRLDLAVGREILEIDRPLGTPHRFPGALVQGDHELFVAAVEVHDEQVAEQERRRAGAAKVVALDIAPLPQHPARFGVDRGRARRTERHVHASRLDDGRRRRIRIERMRRLRLIDVKELQIVENPAGGAIERHRKQIFAVRGRRRRARSGRPGQLVTTSLYREQRPSTERARLRPMSAASFVPLRCRFHRVRGTPAIAPAGEGSQTTARALRRAPPGPVPSL